MRYNILNIESKQLIPNEIEVPHEKTLLCPVGHVPYAADCV